MPLLPDIRSIHWYDGATLKILVDNVSDFSRKRPATMLLFSAQDHNGALQRRPGIKSLIGDASHLCLVIQGKPSISAFIPLLQRDALDYALGSQFDQMLLDGHGYTVGMERAASRDSDGAIHQQDLGADPDTGAFLQELNVVTAPDGEVVLDACATAMEIPPDVSDDRSVTEWIAQDHTFADQTAAAVPGREVVAANGLDWGSEKRTTDGSIQLEDPLDPAVTGPPGAYVLTGRDPAGVMQALVQFDATYGHDAAMVLVDTRLASREQTAPWAGHIIHFLFDRLRALVPNDRKQWVLFGTLGQALLLNMDKMNIAAIASIVPMPLHDQLPQLVMAAIFLFRESLRTSQVDACLEPQGNAPLQLILNLYPPQNTAQLLDTAALLPYAAPLLSGRTDKGNFVLAMALFRDTPESPEVLAALRRHQYGAQDYSRVPYTIEVFRAIPLEGKVLATLALTP